MESTYNINSKFSFIIKGDLKLFVEIYFKLYSNNI